MTTFALDFTKSHNKEFVKGEVKQASNKRCNLNWKTLQNSLIIKRMMHLSFPDLEVPLRTIDW